MKRIQFKPHPSQQALLDNMGRFTVLNCGRRWGKTLFALYIILDALVHGKRVAYFAPNSGRFTNLWDKLNNLLGDLIATRLLTINNTRKEVRVKHTNGYCRFWSMEDINAGRSEYYDIVIIDEAAFIPHLEYTWLNAIRATLVDTRGWAIIMSTPNGTDNYFYELSIKDGKDWYYHHAPTTSNTYLAEEEILSIKDDVPELVYDQEYLAKFIDTTGNDFFYSRQSIVTMDVDVFPLEPLWLSFDFNVNPCTMIMSQKIDRHRALGGGIYFHDELQVQGTTRELCEIFKGTEYYNHPAGLLITGDASGKSMDTTADVLHNNYDIIENILGITPGQFINTRGSNAMHEWSRNVCNTAFHNQFVTFSSRLEVLPQEVKKATPDSRGKLKKDRDKYQMDAVDAMRYQFNAWFPKGVPDIREYKSMLNTVL